MKTKICPVLMIAITLFCFSSALAQQPLTVQGTAPVKLYKAQPAAPQTAGIKPAGPAPAPLGEAQLEAMVLQLRNSSSPATPASTAGDSGRITLSPNSPMSGKNFFDISGGSNSAYTNCAGIDMTGTFIFIFATVPGKTYLLDVSLGGVRNWKCLGAIYGQLQVQNGHLIAGFTATEPRSIVDLKTAQAGAGYFYNAQLIPVN